MMRSFPFSVGRRRPPRAGSVLRLLSLLGLASCGSGLPDPGAGDGSAAKGAGPLVAVHLMEWAIGVSADSIDAGPVTFRVQNGGTDEHDFRVTGTGIADQIRIAPDALADLTLSLPPGSYVLSCSRDEHGINHEGRGMRATLVVRE